MKVELKIFSYQGQDKIRIESLGSITHMSSINSQAKPKKTVYNLDIAIELLQKFFMV
ncbi:MAG: hypothetical protein QNJ70_19385 [Xenococcaceae cyanobacterium MO_207.B15]|nr:hypothetical protein [Xenococcaceae cyanobacterium MO_207.B15]